MINDKDNLWNLINHMNQIETFEIIGTKLKFKLLELWTKFKICVNHKD